MTKQRNSYSKKFKEDAVNYYHSSGKSMKEVADELKVSATSINNWIRKARSNKKIESQKNSDTYSDIKKEISNLKNQLIDKENELIAKETELKEKDNQIIHKDDEIHILKRAVGILYN